MDRKRGWLREGRGGLWCPYPFAVRAIDASVALVKKRFTEAGGRMHHNGAFYRETGTRSGNHGCTRESGGRGTIFKIDRATNAETIL